MKQTLQHINSIILFFLMTGLIGCRTEPTEPVIIVSLDDEFEVGLWENLARDASSLSLNIATIKAVECENTAIDLEVRSSPKIVLTLNGIIPPNNCIEAAVPAQGIANIGYLPEGEHSFQINLEGTTVKNTGNLTVSKESYELNMDTYNGFKLLHKTLMRVPEQTIWGVVNFNNRPQVQTAAQSLVEEIAEISRNKNYSEGYYGHFLIDEKNEITIDQSTVFPNSKPFIFEYKGEINSIQNLLDSYRTEYGENMDIQLLTWEGQEL